MHDTEGLCQVLGHCLLYCGINVQFVVSLAHKSTRHGYGVSIKALREQKSAVGGYSRLGRRGIITGEFSDILFPFSSHNVCVKGIRASCNTIINRSSHDQIFVLHS